MAMTKAEKERMENLERALRLARSLRWPHYPMPQPMTREEIDASKVDGGVQYGSPQKIAKGWLANSHDKGRVEAGCSNGVNHGHGINTTTQGMGRLFKTELDAWQAIRHEMTERFAAVLAHVDAEIEQRS